MKRLLGNNVNVILKSNDDVVSGILFDTEEEYIYIQSDVNLLITIPKENVKYYVSSSFQNTGVIKQDTSSQAAAQPQQQPIHQEHSSIEVYVNQTFIIDIPVPPTFDISTYHDGIMKVVLSNPDVQAVLTGRKQQSLEYIPGKVYISVDDSSSAPTVADLPSNPQSPNSSFSMSSSTAATSTFLNPSQMVTRLNKATKLKPEEVKNE